MEFEYHGEKYRLVRATRSGDWLLFHDIEGRIGWRLVFSFAASVLDEDALDRAKVAINSGAITYGNQRTTSVD